MCDPPPFRQHVETNATNQAYNFSAVISYHCEPGYWFNQFEMNVTKYLTCEADKQWHGPNITNCEGELFGYPPPTGFMGGNNNYGYKELCSPVPSFTRHRIAIFTNCDSGGCVGLLGEDNSKVGV